jgi:hypothetical protein
MISPTPLTQIVIRYSEQGDERALARLAGRDSHPVAGARPDGEVRAAPRPDGKGAPRRHRRARLVPAFVGRLARR